MYISIWIGWIWWMHQMQYFGFTQRTMWWDWKWGSSWTDSNRLEINRNHFHLSFYSQLKSVLSEWSNELFSMNMNFPLLFKYILCFKNVYRTDDPGPLPRLAIVQSFFWCASSRCSSSYYLLMRNSDEITIGKAHST